MPIILSHTAGDVAPEYAITTMQLVRAMVPDADGVIKPKWSGNAYYARTDYLLNADGGRVATVTRPASPTGMDMGGLAIPENMGMPGPVSDPLTGYVNIPKIDIEGGECPTEAAEKAMRADLVERGLINE
jgi:hypothetical protein